MIRRSMGATSPSMSPGPRPSARAAAPAAATVAAATKHSFCDRPRKKIRGRSNQKHRDRSSAMAGLYSMSDLLALMEQQGAQELRVQPGTPPLLFVQGRAKPLKVASLSNEDIQELFRS